MGGRSKILDSVALEPTWLHRVLTARPPVPHRWSYNGESHIACSVTQLFGPPHPPARLSFLFSAKCVQLERSCCVSLERCIIAPQLLPSAPAQEGYGWVARGTKRHRHGRLTGDSKTDLRPTHGTATGLPGRWVGGISNHSVDDAASVGSAASRDCSRSMMRSRLAAVPAPSSGSMCDGPRPAPM